MNFDQILSPIGRDIFYKSFWNQKPVIIEGAIDRFSALPSVEDFPSLLMGRIGEGKWQQTTSLSAQATIANRLNEITFLPSVPLSMCPSLFNNGYSLCFGDMSKCDPQLVTLLQSMKMVVPYPTECSITAYVTPKNANGIVHFDSQHVFFVQRNGTKFWKVAKEAAVLNPVTNFIYNKFAQSHIEQMKHSGYDIRLPRDCGSQDFRLKQGDVLYLPPGYYHCQHTEDDISFHYTLTFEPHTFRQGLLDIVSYGLLQDHQEANRDIRNMDQSEVLIHIENCLDKAKKRLNAQTSVAILKRLTQS